MAKDIKCHRCQRDFTTHEEKRTDVNIACKILTDAVNNVFDKAVIISADSDLLPVIKTVEKIAPEKEIGVMFPIGRTNYELRQNASFRIKMSQKLLQESQFPDQVRIGSSVITRPANWR